MVEIKCRMTKPDQPGFDLTIRFDTPTKAAGDKHFECMLHFVGMQSMAIGGATPLGAMSNAMTVAKGFVEGNGRNVVDWM